MDKLILAFNELMQNKFKYKLQETTDNEEYNNKTFIIYSHPDFPENTFLQELKIEDSYGNTNIHSFKFVKKIEKITT